MSVDKIVPETNVATCDPFCTINEAAQIMRNKEVGAVIVVYEEKPIGIITDHDIVVRYLASEKLNGNEKVRDFMTSSLKTASVGDGIYDVIEMMKEAGVPYMPIVDKKGKVISLVSQRDLYSLLSDELNTLSTTLVKTSIQLRSHRPDKSDKSNKAA